MDKKDGSCPLVDPIAERKPILRTTAYSPEGEMFRDPRFFRFLMVQAATSGRDGSLIGYARSNLLR
jgi:hypothetical protein